MPGILDQPVANTASYQLILENSGVSAVVEGNMTLFAHAFSTDPVIRGTRFPTASALFDKLGESDASFTWGKVLNYLWKGYRPYAQYLEKALLVLEQENQRDVMVDVVSTSEVGPRRILPGEVSAILRKMLSTAQFRALVADLSYSCNLPAATSDATDLVRFLHNQCEITFNPPRLQFLSEAVYNHHPAAAKCIDELGSPPAAPAPPPTCVNKYNFVSLFSVGWDSIFHDSSGRFWCNLFRNGQRIPKPANVNPGPVFEMFSRVGLLVEELLAALKSAHAGAYTLAKNFVDSESLKSIDQPGVRKGAVASYSIPFDIPQNQQPIPMALPRQKVGMDYLVSLVQAQGLPEATVKSMVTSALQNPQLLERLRRPDFLGPVLNGKSLLNMISPDVDERFAWVIAPLVVLIERAIDPYRKDLFSIGDSKPALLQAIQNIYGELPIRLLALPFAGEEDWFRTLELAKLDSVNLINMIENHVSVDRHFLDRLDFRALLDLLDKVENIDVKKKFLDSLVSQLNAEGIQSQLFLWHNLPRYFEPKVASQLIRVQDLKQVSPSSWEAILVELGLDQVPNGLKVIKESGCEPCQIPSLELVERDEVLKPFNRGQRLTILEHCRRILANK